MKKRIPHFGSFYLRVGAIAFGIGTMVYSGLEFGQYFELNASPGCSSIFIALTPAARMLLSLVQMQFIFLVDVVELFRAPCVCVCLCPCAVYKGQYKVATSTVPSPP